MAVKQIDVIRADIATLGASEKITKGLIASLASDCVAFVQEHGQSGVLNELLLVLTPANKKAVIAFFRKFSGFVWTKEEKSFTKKLRPQPEKDGSVKSDPYADAVIAFNEFNEAGHNFWTWFNAQGKAEKPEAAPLDLGKLTTSVKNAAEKAKKQGISRTAFFNAVVSDVFTAEEILDLLAAAGNVNQAKA